MGKEYFSGITGKQLTQIVSDVCHAKGIITEPERDKNGDRFIIFFPPDKYPLIKHSDPIVLISHEDNALDDMMGTPKPLELHAKRNVIREVKKVTRTSTSTA